MNVTSTNTSKLLINCDMGEWDAPHLMPIDDELMPYIDMCNIACGGHAGSEKIMELAMDSAIAFDIKVGAHPGFEDRKNFGRKYVALSAQELSQSLETQLQLFLDVCTKEEVRPFHVKAHGALYHACNQNEMEAEILVKVIKALCPDLLVFVAAGSLLETKANSEGIKTMTESFIDRKYNDDLTLVSRTESNAVISDAVEAQRQYQLLSEGKIITKTGKTLILQSETACIHGDNPNCLQILRTIRNA